MQAILFEGLTEESRHGFGSCGLDVCGGPDLDVLAEGDVLWVVTRLAGDRETPALCARLVAKKVEWHRPGASSLPSVNADCERRLIVRRDLSERCAPIACTVIHTWEVWRHPFRGVRVLDDEQGRALDAVWASAERHAR